MSAAALTLTNALAVGHPGFSTDISAQPQTVLVLVGLPGSGKTTFAEALVRASEQTSGRRRWIRASQDDAPSRRRQECEARVRWGLRGGYNVVVDRVGFDEVGHFVAIAKQNDCRVFCLVLDVTLSTLQQRLRDRPSHPTIPDAATGLRVLGQMRSQFSPPTEGAEGFDRVYHLCTQPAVWTDDEVWSVLGAVETGHPGTMIAELHTREP